MSFVLIVPLSSLVVFIGPPLDTSGSYYTVMRNIWLYELDYRNNDDESNSVFTL